LIGDLESPAIDTLWSPGSLRHPACQAQPGSVNHLFWILVCDWTISHRKVIFLLLA